MTLKEVENFLEKQELQELDLKKNALRELKTAKMALGTEGCFVACERIINDYNNFNSFMFKFSWGEDMVLRLEINNKYLRTKKGIKASAKWVYAMLKTFGGKLEE